MTLEGKVTSGIGIAKMWVGKIEKVFNEKTKMDLFHGTLNVRLNEDYILKPDFIIKPEEFGGTEKVLVQQCKIFKEKAYIVRAEKNQKRQGDHDLQVIEIVSSINFREKYGITDDYEIKILIEFW